MNWLVVVSTGVFMAASFFVGRYRAKNDSNGFHGGHAGVWIWGAFLIAFLFWLGVLFFSAIHCDPKSVADGLELSKDGDFCEATEAWFLVLTEWQSGVGAVIGLLGVAWAAFYKSVYNK